MVTQRSVNYKKDCRAKFESYVEAITDAMVTNGKTPQTYGCIALGTCGNRQGSLKCFDLKSGKVMTRRVFKVIPMPDRVVKLVKYWVMQSKLVNRKNKPKLINHHGKKFDWDNKELDNNDNVEESQQKLVHPDNIANIPRVELENDYKNIVGHVLQLEEDNVKDMAQSSAAARENFDAGKNVH